MSALTRRVKDASDINAFTRRGACPALSAPMQTGDGLLVRVNPVAGGLSPKALIGLCKAALHHGNGVMEVTARGSLQIRGLTPASASLFAAEVDALGIAVRTDVPVQTSALAGLDPDEIADPTSLAEKIRAGIVQAGLEGGLGPKVSVVVDGGGRSRLGDVAADVRLTAVREETNTLWQISISGDAAAAKPLALLGYSAVVDASLTILTAIAAMGIKSRASDLSAAQCDGFATHMERKPPKALGSLGVFQLTDSRHALGVALPFGHTSAENLAAFGERAKTLGVADVRLAPKHTILALCSSRESAEALQEHVQKLGFVVSDSDPRAQISACPGAPACASGHIAARDLAAEIANDYSDILDGTFTLHVSGCAKGCAHPGQAALTLIGSENGAGIVVGGTARDVPLAYTAQDDAKRGLGNVAELVLSEAREGENSAATLARLDPARIAEAFEKK